jgi:hypothetical protein
MHKQIYVLELRHALSCEYISSGSVEYVKGGRELRTLGRELIVALLLESVL